MMGAVTLNRALVWDSRDLHPISDAAHDLKTYPGHIPLDSVALSQSIFTVTNPIFTLLSMCF